MLYSHEASPRNDLRHSQRAADADTSRTGLETEFSISGIESDFEMLAGMVEINELGGWRYVLAEIVPIVFGPIGQLNQAQLRAAPEYGLDFAGEGGFLGELVFSLDCPPSRWSKSDDRLGHRNCATPHLLIVGRSARLRQPRGGFVQAGSTRK